MPIMYEVPEDEDSLEEPSEPIEDDLVTEDHSKFYQCGKLVLTVDRDASELEMWRAIETYMAKANFWPGVWFISDHGNAHPMSPPWKCLTCSREGTGPMPGKCPKCLSERDDRHGPHMMHEVES
jgi:hypothetical protein